MAQSKLSQQMPAVQSPIPTSRLAFNNVQFHIIDRAGKPWVRGIQIGYALEYQNPAQAISKLYDSHADEFTDAMTAVIKLPSEGGEQETRIFSLRGCHLLAMFARTPVAKAFRKWVLDVLEAWEAANAKPSLPTAPLAPFLPPPRYLPPVSRRRLVSLVDAKTADVPSHHVWRARMGIWSSFNRRFAIPQYRLLPEGRMADAIAFLSSLEIGPHGKIILKGQQALPMCPDEDAKQIAATLGALVEQASDILAALLKYQPQEAI